MRHALEGLGADGLSDDAQGLALNVSLLAAIESGGAKGLMAALDARAPAWLADPKANDTSGALFILFDLGLPLAFLCLIMVIRATCSRCQPESDEPVCLTPKVLCPDNTCRSLTWWDRSRVAGFVRTLANPDDVDLIPPPWSMGTLSWVLDLYGISMESWGEDAKQFLLKELSTGRSRLLRKDRRPMRVVELVLLVVDSGRGRCVLQEAVPEQPGIVDAPPERTPTTRRRMGESVQAAAVRCLAEKVNIPREALKVHEKILSITDAVEYSRSFPSLMTIARKFLVHVEVVASDPGTLQGIGLPTADPRANLGRAGLTYSWTPTESAEALAPHLRRSSCLGQHWKWDPRDAERDSPQTLLDSTFKAMLPWTEEEVRDVLHRHKVRDPQEAFGRRVPELAAELSAGRYSLGIRKSDASLVCVQDLFSLLLTTVSGHVLVDTSASLLGEEPPSSSSAKLPCDAKLASEDPWIAARRIALAQLGIQAHDLGINERQVVQQVWPGSYALEREERHRGGQRPANWVLREWVVLSSVPGSYRVLNSVPAPPLV